MPRLLDTLSRTNTVTNAVNDLLAADGAAGLTMRRIAAECRLSTAALGSHYGSREHLLRVAGYTTSEGLLDHQRQMVAVHGLVGLLPREPDDVVDARVWLGWCELGRSHEALEQLVARHRAEQRALVARRHDYLLGREEIDGVLALVDGLQVAVCDPVRPLPLPRVRTLFERHVRLLLRDAAPASLPEAPAAREVDVRSVIGW